ncbi:hypothetical protein F2P56_034938, partial [Juglans regia]
VLVPIIFSEMRGSKFRDGRKFLNAVVLLQYVPRLFRIYRLWKRVNQTIILPKSIPPTTTTSSCVKVVNAESYKNMMMIPPKGFIVMKAGFNLFLYLVASHILGAFWYFFSIERETTCWNVACKQDTGCSKTSFNCGHGFSNNTYLNNFCSIEKPNTTLFDFGIFQEARQSGILASMDFPRKTMFCFWWGLRNLRYSVHDLSRIQDYEKVVNLIDAETGWWNVDIVRRVLPPSAAAEKNSNAGESSNSAAMNVLWKKIWKLSIPNRVRVFAWRACRNGLPTMENLKLKKFDYLPVDGDVADLVNLAQQVMGNALSLYKEHVEASKPSIQKTRSGIGWKTPPAVQGIGVSLRDAKGNFLLSTSSIENEVNDPMETELLAILR